MKLGRNAACPCGSGKKFKKCCLGRPPLDSGRDAGGRLIGRPFIDTVWKAQGKRVRAVGSGIELRPTEETDHEFFIHVLQRHFGESWHKQQLAKPALDRHVVEQWVDHWSTVRARGADGVETVQHGPKLFSTTQTGDLKALLCLGYDLYTVEHHGALPKALLRRLRDAEQFQGARYEVAVAAVFARTGYEIEWITATDRKLPEFIARHPRTKTEVAVEAKSRHRPGVLGRKGQTPPAASLTVDVAELMRRALTKEAEGRPFVVCLDLNLPTAQERSLEKWTKLLHEKVLAEHGMEATGEPDPFAAVFVTNYSWHWDGENPAGDPIQIATLSHSAAASLPRNEFDLLAEALFQYGDVPSGTP
jgi:hypothetical protein